MHPQRPAHPSSPRQTRHSESPCCFQVAARVHFCACPDLQRPLHPGHRLANPLCIPRCLQVAAEIHFSELGGFGYAKNWVALAILLGMLAAIATEKVRLQAGQPMRCCAVAALEA